MSINTAFILLFLLLNIISPEKCHKSNYTININKIIENKCEKDSNKFNFKLDCSIFPAPYCDTYFNLSLSNPKDKIAVCTLIDDINNKINCIIEDVQVPLKIEFKRQYIELNGYRTNIDIHESPIESKGMVFCNDIFLKKYFNNLNLFLLILFLI